jgi:small-conductance mechanosensitive channel
VNRPQPHTTDSIGTWLVVAGLTLLTIVIAIWATAGTRAGIVAALALIVLPSAAVVLLVVLFVIAGRLHAVQRRLAAARRDAALGDDRPGPAELLDDFAAAAVRFPYPAERGREV